MSNDGPVPSTEDKQAEVDTEAWLEALSHQQRDCYQRQETTLASYAKLGTLKKAAALAGISRETHRNWESQDTLGYRQRFRDAHAEFVESQESLLYTLNEGLVPGQNVTGLLATLNANHPDKWRGNQQTVVVEDSVLQALASLQALDAETRKQLPAAKVVEGEATVEKFPWE